MIHTLIPIPRTHYGQVLYCIHRISGNKSDFPEELCGSAVEESRGEKDGFQAGDLWDAVINGTRRAYFWKDREGRYQGANRAFLQYAGLSSLTAVKGKTPQQLGWLMDSHGTEEMEKHVLSGGVVANQPTDLIVKGTVKNVVYGKVPIYRDGEIIGTLGWFEDAEQMEKDTGRQPVMVTDKVTGVMNSRGGSLSPL